MTAPNFYKTIDLAINYADLYRGIKYDWVIWNQMMELILNLKYLSLLVQKMEPLNEQARINKEFDSTELDMYAHSFYYIGFRVVDVANSLGVISKNKRGKLGITKVRNDLICHPVIHTFSIGYSADGPSIRAARILKLGEQSLNETNIHEKNAVFTDALELIEELNESFLKLISDFLDIAEYPGKPNKKLVCHYLL